MITAYTVNVLVGVLYVLEWWFSDVCANVNWPIVGDKIVVSDSINDDTFAYRWRIG